MRTLRCLLMLAAVLGLSNLAAAMYERSTMLFLVLPPSPAANGMAGVLTTQEMNDPFAVMINPAALGYLANHQCFGMGFYPQKTAWLPGFDTPGIWYSTRMAFVGVNADRLSKWAETRIPVSFGVAYSEVNLDLGKYTVYNPPDNPELVSSYENAKNLSMGVGYDGAVQAAFGWTLRWATSHLGHDEAEGIAHDLGLHVQCPLPQLFHPDRPIQPGLNYFVTPSFGYAATNIGHAVSYTHATGADPLPRTGRVTVGLGAGLTLDKHDGTSWQWLQVESVVQGEDELIEVKANGDYRYRQPLGDIHVFKDLVLGFANDRIEKRKGWEISLFEIFMIRRGSWEDISDHLLLHSSGYGLRLAGMFKLAQRLEPELTASPTAAYVMKHFDAEYSESQWNYPDTQYSPLAGTTFKGVSILFR